MLVTEEEAKTKRCQESFGDGNVTPTGHMVAVHACGGSAYGIGTSPSMCIGSACMAWRWHAWTEYVPDPDKDHHFVAGPMISKTHGYCGKVGRVLGIADPTKPPPEENR